MAYLGILSFAFIAILLLTVVGAYDIDSISKDIVNQKVERKIDLTSQLVKISTKVTLENTGKTDVTTFLISLEPSQKEGLSFLDVQLTGGEKRSVVLTETVVKEHQGRFFWKANLLKSLAPGASIQIVVETVFTHRLVPHPARISQAEKQLVRFYGNHYFFSPYKTVSQTTIVTLASSNVEQYNKLKPVSLSDNVITYGSYSNVEPFSFDEMSVHYENNSPFLAVTKLERTIEVSHWGNIAIEETIDVRHTGAILKGSFSRYDYQREHTSGVASVKSFKTSLPAAARDVYYRDEIGNISTSNMKVLEDEVELDLRPRFPLFGGWKTHYVIGYNIPSYEYLYYRENNYGLRLRFLDHLFDDMVVDELMVKIILPEGSRDMQLEAPYPVKRLEDTLVFTYLDTKGRPVITAYKMNLCEGHIQDFTLYYTFPRIVMMTEPLLLVLAFLLLFGIVIIYMRLDFSITTDELAESRMKVSGYLEKVQSYQDRRNTIYTLLEEQLTKLKASKDINACQAAVKNLNSDHKNHTQAIADLLTNIKNEGSEMSDKVAELQRLDKTLKEHLTQHLTYAEKLVSGRTGKQQFVDLESQLNKKKEDCVEKIDTLMQQF